ncbi:MAG: class I SAM-dependent methyltransferase [Kiritimatiellae bacterium]|nr:class I SAM-dependent methyltransferase [Kiritimatiellia bacterium]MCO5069351.1 class I SAM-dependent methyltransferase [Kiritimatiellia bacterium]
MSNAEMWNDRFRVEGFAYGVEASLYLRGKADLLRAGQRALVVADGGGRNGVWLAERGLEVLSVDFSQEGLARAAELAVARGVSLELVCADLTRWVWPVGVFDWVVSVYCHFGPEDRVRVHRAMVDALRPGGHILVEAFHKDQIAYQSGGPRDVALLYDEASLCADFADAEVVECGRVGVTLDESRLHRGPGVLIRALIRRR